MGRNGSHIPYLVNVQSRRHDGAGTRVVVPLMRLPRLRDVETRLMPKFVIQDEQLVFNPLLLLPAPAATLGPAVASLAADDESSRIVAAIDAVITQAFG